MLELKLAGLKLQVSYVHTGGNIDLLNQLTLETRQQKAPFRVSRIYRWQESSREARRGCAPGKAANKGLLFVLVGAAVTVPWAARRDSIRGGARVFRYDLQSRFHTLIRL